jgi:hypothetical protein
MIRIFKNKKLSGFIWSFSLTLVLGLGGLIIPKFSAITKITTINQEIKEKIVNEKNQPAPTQKFAPKILSSINQTSLDLMENLFSLSYQVTLDDLKVNPLSEKINSPFVFSNFSLETKNSLEKIIKFLILLASSIPIFSFEQIDLAIDQFDPEVFFGKFLISTCSNCNFTQQLNPRQFIMSKNSTDFHSQILSAKNTKILGIIESREGTTAIVADQAGNIYYLKRGEKIGAKKSEIINIDQKGIFTTNSDDNILWLAHE